MALTQVDQGLLSSTAQYTGFKNRIINGAMGIWQRGTSGFASSGYGPDRFIVSANSALTAAQSSDVPSGFKYSLSLSGTGYPQTTQRIESTNCTDLAGQSVTISFWAKQTSGASAGSLGILLFYANASDNFSGGITQIGSGQTFTGTTGWVQYSYTFTSLPAQAANGLQLIAYANTAGAATWYVTGVQLEKGSTATSFDYRPYGTELALCQRYCLAIPYMIGNQYATTISTFHSFFPVEMRAAPTGINSTWTVTSLSLVGVGSATSLASLAANTTSTKYIRAQLSHAAAGAIGIPAEAVATANSYISAEL